MKYALLIYGERDLEENLQLSEEERRSIVAEFLALKAEEPGVYGAAQLQPAESATTLRMQEGTVLTTDGPFANTKEVLGGVWLLEADNLDTALALAGRIPALRVGGAVEVRPIVER
jgi:hypothetical protein